MTRKPATAPAVPAGDMPLRHGYTLTQIQGLAVQAARREWWHRTRDFHERTDIAWSAIVERLYTSDERPAANDLAIAGMAAINQFYEKDLQQHGIYDHGTFAEHGHAPTGVNFGRYWFFTTSPAPSPEDSVVDRLALAQIWASLTPGARKAFLALAAFGGDYNAAAAALGNTYDSYTWKLVDARRQFLARWHEHEKPSRVWGRNDPRRNSGRPQHTAAELLKKRRRRRRSNGGGTAPASGAAS
jgi:hypothetical protein